MAWNPGDKINGGNYRVDRELGKGRFGATYLVRDRRDRPFAVKTLNDELVGRLTLSELTLVQLTLCVHLEILKRFALSKAAPNSL